jgi:glycosyltransferase involved in cell wall biosynthesis
MTLEEGDGEHVSVVVPTYYRNNMLRETIESVYRQEHRPIEIVVVDDSGEANAEPVVDDYEEVTYVPLEENQGPQAARNVGLERASGEYVQFLDDDDILRKDKFVKQLQKTDDRVGVVYSGMEVYETGEVISPKPDVRGEVLKDALRLRLYPCSNCTMLIDMSVLDDLLPLKNRHAADDLGLMIELARRTQFDFVDEPLIYVREELETALGKSWENIRARKQLVMNYSGLYDRYPTSVKAHALSQIYRIEGKKHLEDSVWSPKAILAYGRSAYYAPVNRPFRTLDFFTSFLGRPGLKLADRIRAFSGEYIVN